MKFHITITDNETGETIISEDAVAIICAAGNDKGQVSEIVQAYCSTAPLLATAAAAITAARRAVEDKPRKHRRKVERVAKKVARDKKKGSKNK